MKARGDRLNFVEIFPQGAGGMHQVQGGLIMDQPFDRYELELISDAVLNELYDLDVTCNRALLLMALHQKIERLLEGAI